MAVVEDETVFMTVREMVKEIRTDVKEMSKRVSALENVGFELRGAWTAVGVGVSVVVGIAGLCLGAFALF